MAKFYGSIGYVESVETSPGVWENKATERKYTGELLRNNRRRDTPNDVNDSINISSEISILADPYAMEHFFAISYLKFDFPNIGGIWKVSSVNDVDYHRMTLSLGGLYNGITAESSD